VWALRWQMMAGGLALSVAALCLFRSEYASMAAAVLGALTFLFMWWIGVLLFDLSYVWKRYINTTNTQDTFLHQVSERTKWWLDESKM